MKKLFLLITVSFSLSGISQVDKWIKISNTMPSISPSYPALKFDALGNFYYAFSNNLSPSSSLNVLRFSGGFWQPVGVSDITSGAFIREKDLAISTIGEPYVVFVNGTNDLTVLKYSLGLWDTVGLANFGQTDGLNYQPKIEIDPVTNQPIVAYRELVNGKLSVKIFNGTNWVYYNNGQDISEGQVKYVDMTIQNSGQVFVGFSNIAEGDSLSIYTSYSGATDWFVFSNDTVVSNGPIASLDLAQDIAYPVAAYTNATDGQNYVHRLSGPPLWIPFGGGALGEGITYGIVAVARHQWNTYVGFSDDINFYQPKTVRISDANFFASAPAENVDPGFDFNTPDYMTFGVDDEDSLYLAYDIFDIKIFKLRTISDVGINQNSTNISTSIYPNPANTEILINSTYPWETYRLLTADGKVVLDHQVFSNNTTIDISQLNKGMYFLQLNSENNSAVEKLIIQ